MWKVYDLDEKWLQLNRRRDQLKTMFVNMKEFVELNPTPLAERVPPITAADIDAVATATSFVVLKDYYMWLMQYYGGFVDQMRAHRRRIADAARKAARQKEHSKTVSVVTAETHASEATAVADNVVDAVIPSAVSEPAPVVDQSANVDEPEPVVDQSASVDEPAPVIDQAGGVRDEGIEEDSPMSPATVTTAPVGETGDAHTEAAQVAIPPTDMDVVEAPVVDAPLPESPSISAAIDDTVPLPQRSPARANEAPPTNHDDPMSSTDADVAPVEPVEMSANAEGPSSPADANADGANDDADTAAEEELVEEKQKRPAKKNAIMEYIKYGIGKCKWRSILPV